MSSLQSIGQELKEARQSRGLSLEQVAGATRLSVRHLHSLEEGDETSLPEPFYIKSFIIKYANHLGLPGAELGARYWEDHKEPHPTSAAPASEGSPWWLFPFLATLGLILAVGLAWWFSQHRAPVVAHSPSPLPVVTESPIPVATASLVATASPVASPSVRPSASPRPKPSPTVKATPRPTPSAALSATPSPMPSATPSVSVGRHVLVLAASEPCWVVVSADGKTVYSGMLKPGERVRFAASRNMSFRLGNAGGVRVNMGGEDLGVLGKTGEVVERTFAF
ncbi:MAG: RodZ domain-containing protein [Bacteroidota bacterium]